MSGRLPVVKGRDLIQALKRLGFDEVRRSKGSHVQLSDSVGRVVTVPDHGSADICCGLLQKILHSSGVSKDILLRNL